MTDNETEFANQDLDIDFFDWWVYRLKKYCQNEHAKALEAKDTVRGFAARNLEHTCQAAEDMIDFYRNRHNEKHRADPCYSEDVKMKSQIVRDFAKENEKGFEDDKQD